MTEPTEPRSEAYLRFSHRSMVFLLVLIISLGAAALAMALRPDGDVSRWLARVPWFLPVAIIIALGVLQSSLRGHRWNPASPEGKAIMRDEWRRTNMDRAMRAAFIVVLVAQVPLGLLLTNLPPPRALMAMAVSTIAMGMATLVALFLFFDRGERDGR